MVKGGDLCIFNVSGFFQVAESSKCKEGSENGQKDVTSAGRCITHTLIQHTHVESP